MNNWIPQKRYKENRYLLNTYIYPNKPLFHNTLHLLRSLNIHDIDQHMLPNPNHKLNRQSNQVYKVSCKIIVHRKRIQSCITQKLYWNWRRLYHRKIHARLHSFKIKGRILCIRRKCVRWWFVIHNDGNLIWVGRKGYLWYMLFSSNQRFMN